MLGSIRLRIARRLIGALMLVLVLSTAFTGTALGYDDSSIEVDDSFNTTVCAPVTVQVNVIGDNDNEREGSAGDVECETNSDD